MITSPTSETLIVVVPVGGVDVGELYHLPRPYVNGRGSVQTHYFGAASWPTLCGRTGAIYQLAGCMLARRLCEACASA